MLHSLTLSNFHIAESENVSIPAQGPPSLIDRGPHVLVGVLSLEYEDRILTKNLINVGFCRGILVHWI